MSVVTIPSPNQQLSRPKRLLEEDSPDWHSGFGHGQQAKRSRINRSYHHQQQQEPGPVHVGGVGALNTASDQLQAYSALLALFPGMDEKVVQGVLVECNYSIDAAIKRLTDLRLSTEDATVAAATAAASGGTTTSADPAGGEAAAAAVAAQQPQQPGQQQPAVQQPPAEAAEEAPQGPQSAEQWIDYLVTHMMASKDMTDARSRAAGVLQHFEQFVKKRQQQEGDVRVAELVKENSIYKRAVQIQAARMDASKKAAEEELAAARLAVAQYQEQCRKLELHAYSLAMHLQQATSSSSSGLHQRPPPDVF